MAMPRPMMILRDRRDRILLQQQQQGHGLPRGPVCPPLHPHGHFNRPPNRFEGEEEEFGRILPPPPVGWEGHQQQQQALAGVMFRRRMNLQQHHPGPSPLLHQQQPGQPPQEWDGPHPSVQEVMRMRQPMGLVGREHVGLDGEFLGGFRQREDMGDLRNPEHLKLVPMASHDKLIESEFLRNASRATHEKLIEREQHLKNAYRASHEKLIEKDYLKNVSRSAQRNPMENERPQADVTRPFHGPLQSMEPPGRNHTGPYGGWDESVHSDLVIRYGARQPGCSQDLSSDASIPPGFQSVIMSCKRPRDEDTDFERSSLQRPRRSLGVDHIPSGIHPHPLQRPKEELDQPKLHFGISRNILGDEEHEEGQVTPPPPTIPVYRAEPIGPPGFYKPDREIPRHFLSKDLSTSIVTRGSLPETHLPGSSPPRFHDPHSLRVVPEPVSLLRAKSGSSRPSTARDVGNDLGLSSRPASTRAIGIELGSATRPSTGRSSEVDPVHISRPSAVRALGSDSPTRRPLPQPQSVVRASEIDSPSRRVRSVGIDTGSTSRPSTARPLGIDSGLNSRPSTARTASFDSGLGSNQHDRGRGPLKGEILMPKRERASPTPLRKYNEQLSTRQERVSGGGEVNASLSSDVSNVRRGVGKDSDIRSRHVEGRAVERDNDSEHRKRPYQDEVMQQETRPYTSSRKTRLIPDSEGRPSKGSRWDDALQLKSARQSTPKESRQGREMTTSGTKHGQRIVKVEESKLRASVSRSPVYNHSRHERGGVRDGPESSSKNIERLSENRSKESEHLLPLAGQDKGLGSQSNKDATNSRHSHGSSSHERVAFLPHQVKKEVILLSEKAEPEPPQCPAILSRLSTSKPDSIPTNTRLRTEMVRQEKLASQANSKALLPSFSKKQSLAHAHNVGGKLNFDPVVEDTDRPVTKQVASIGDVEEKTMSTSLRTLSGKVAGKVQATREELNYQLSARLLKLQIPDGSKGEDDAVQMRHPSISISPNGIKNVYSPFQKGPDGLQWDSRLPESRNMHKTDSLHLRLEAPSLPTIDLLASSAVNPVEASIEVNEQFPGCRPTPKLIFTGHKSEQSLKETSPQADNSLKESHGLVMPRIQDAKTTLEKSENRKAMVAVLPKASGDTSRRFELTEARNPIPVFRTSQYIVACDAGPASPQWNVSKNKVRSLGKQVETPRKSSASPNAVSVCLATSVPPVNSMRKQAGPIEFSQGMSLSTDVSGILEKEEEERDHAGGNLLPASLEEKVELAIVSTAVPPRASTPKEVRLFGANLIAPVIERLDSSPKNMEVVKPLEPEIFPVSATHDVQPVIALPQTVESSAGPGETGNGRGESAGNIATEQAIPAKDLGEQSHEGQHSAEPMIPDAPEVQAQSNELPSQEKQVVTIPSIPKGGSAIGRLQSSSRPAGANTWLRRGTSSAAPASSVLGFRNSSSGIGGVSQPAVRGRGTQGAAYVRKGNSLVRAPGTVTLPSSSVLPTGMLGQIWANQGPSQKPPLFRNSFPPTQDSIKSSQPVLRKGLGPTADSAGGVSSVSRSVTTPSGGSSQGNCVSLAEPGISLSRPKTPPQVTVGVGMVLKTGPVISAPSLPQSGTGSRLQNPAGDDAADNSTEVTNNSPGSKTPTVVNSSNSVNPSLGSNNMIYVRRKANQLVVAPCLESVDSSLAENQAVNKQLMPDLYIKRKTNQLVRNSGIKGNGNSSFVQALLRNGPPKELTEEGSCNSSLYKKMRLGRVLRQKKGLTGRSSWVWTLSGATLSHDADINGHVRKPAPPLFPWKRHSLTTSIRSRRVRSLPEGKKGSFLSVMSERLRRVRPVQPVYTRSADGFSLHRSGVLSVGGGNLKWTKSLENRAKLASEAATKAVAAAESRKREKKEAVVEAAVKAKRVTRKVTKGAGERIVWVGLTRYKMDATSKTLQRIPDTKGDSGAAMSSGPAKILPLLTPRRSYIGGTVYLRVGNGNQLVRDPKAASQALASEKVRWSLHHARSRGAKKQQYCQFFTRFGKCNKENGKCIYIHDPDKVAVCTKFLKGTCDDDQCLLTHKVIPERMPDCSFFLEGLCTNESCPYRHVNVNPKAPYCDGFLRGYCKDGDKCTKKHTYVCPTHAATGECSDQSTCKLHHPKKKGKVELAISRKLGTKRKRRYFCSTEAESRGKSEKKEVCAVPSVAEEEIPPEDEKNTKEDLVEFISLTNTEEQDGDAKISPDTQKPWSFKRPGVPSFIMKETLEAESGSAQEVERWIRPTFLFKVTSPAAS